MSIKLVWRVCEPPVGRYRSFERRGWPTASYNTDGGPIAARIECEDEYVPSKVRTGDHAELSVYVAQWSRTEEDWKRYGGLVWRRLKKRAATLQEAKRLAESAIKAHPNMIPKEVQP
jgi:hypothetical protein